MIKKTSLITMLALTIQLRSQDVSPRAPEFIRDYKLIKVDELKSNSSCECIKVMGVRLSKDGKMLCMNGDHCNSMLNTKELYFSEMLDSTPFKNDQREHYYNSSLENTAFCHNNNSFMHVFKNNNTQERYCLRCDATIPKLLPNCIMREKQKSSLDFYSTSCKNPEAFEIVDNIWYIFSVSRPSDEPFSSWQSRDSWILCLTKLVPSNKTKELKITGVHELDRYPLSANTSLVLQTLNRGSSIDIIIAAINGSFACVYKFKPDAINVSKFAQLHNVHFNFSSK